MSEALSHHRDPIEAKLQSKPSPGGRGTKSLLPPGEGAAQRRMRGVNASASTTPHPAGRRRSRGCLRAVEPQFPLALGGVGAMAPEALVRQDRPDIAIEPDAPGGRATGAWGRLRPAVGGAGQIGSQHPPRPGPCSPELEDARQEVYLGVNVVKRSNLLYTIRPRRGTVFRAPAGENSPS